MKITNILRKTAGFTMPRIKDALFPVLALLCCSVLLTSCNKDFDSTVNETYNLQLSFNIPDAKENNSSVETNEVTKHGTPVPGSTDESAIRELAIFVFSSGTLETTKFLSIDSSNSSTDSAWDSATSSVRLIVTAGTKDIYMIANWSGTATTEMPDITGITTVAGLTSQIRYHNGVTPTNPPVMTGMTTVTITGGEQNLFVDLTRQIARVDTNFKINDYLLTVGANVTIQGIKFTGLAQQAYLYPKATPASPSTATWDQTSFVGTASSQLTGTSTAYELYYIPEYIGSSPSHTTMIIHAKYNGTDTYYGVAMNNETGAVPAQYGVERNHSYRYFITIQGVGSSTESGAATRAMDLDADNGANIIYELVIE